MYITELAEPQLLVIYPGRFQPFHKGHHAVYDWLTGKFGRNNVYIATSNKIDAVKSPFTFAEKSYFMQLTGVPADRIVQAAQPYKIEDILAGGHITVANPANTVVIFAVSQKDMAEDPRFSFAPKKDGSPSYFQKLTDIKQTEPMDKHGYVMVAPTFDFGVLENPMTSASEIRALYSTSDELTRQKIVKDLFGKYTHEAEQIMTAKLGGTTKEPADSTDYRYSAESVEESMSIASFQTLKKFVKGQTVELLGPLKDQSPGKIKGPGNTGYDILVAPTHMNPEGILRGVHPRLIGRVLANAVREDGATADGYYKLLAHRYKQNPGSLSRKEKEQLHSFLLQRKVFKEEAGGVGVVRGGNDPRYMTATMGDQNDVDGNTLSQEMQAYGLIGRKEPKTGQKPVGKNAGKGQP